MKFIDEVRITIQSGKGGKGASTFRREKFVPFGGPDGGNGGNGGNVFFQASKDINTLMKFRGKKVFLAEDGIAGAARQMDGRCGTDLILQVPIGTIVRDMESSIVLADLKDDEEKVMVAQGGRGGLGNANFKTSTNQAPRYAQKGEEGTILQLELELKLLADIALIGLPNAGKSTLISVISAARPKIADYPFTTLEPNLGVVESEEKAFVVADIPGLIENASEGKGLGFKFLKHIERTKAFVHLVDCSMCIDEYEAYENYVIVRHELEKYNKALENKKELVCLTKIDALSEKEIERYVTFFEESLQKKVLPISAVAKKNISTLTRLMAKIIGPNK